MFLPEKTLLQGGKYQIVRFISSGGFGCTYEAEHVMLHKRVAIKEFFVKDFCNRDETTSQVTVGITSKSALVEKLKKKFVEEAQSLCSLEHPNIVHVFDVFEDNGTAYYVMDYIDGPSLNELVKKTGSISEQQALEYIKQVAGALKYVHSRNRLHLDLKPGNIMIDKNGKAILIDFGASKQYDEVEGENTSTLLGKTPGYAPLEQMGNDVVKFLPSTDIYALGATLYKLLTGVTPPSASLLASGEVLGEFPSAVSSDTRNAIIASMQTNKLKRPQSVDEFLRLFSTNAEEPVKGKNKEDDKTIIDEEPASSSLDSMKMTVSHKAEKKKSKESSTPQSNDSKSGSRKNSPTYYKKSINYFICLQVVGILIVLVVDIFGLFNGTDKTRELLRTNEIIFIFVLLGMLWSTIFIKRKTYYRWSFLIWDAILIAVLLTACIDYFDLSTKMSWERGHNIYRNIRYIGYCCKYDTSLVVAVFGPLYLFHNAIVLLVMYGRTIYRKLKR